MSKRHSFVAALFVFATLSLSSRVSAECLTTVRDKNGTILDTKNTKAAAKALIESGKQLHKLLITNTPFEKRFNQYLKSVFINFIISQTQANVPQLSREIVINITSYVSSHHFYEKQREITPIEINRITEGKRAIAIHRAS